MRGEHRAKAKLLRRVSATTGLTKALRRATRALSELGIPSLVVGGYAVQEHGYARYTADVDLIVSDLDRARDCLSIAGFVESVGPGMSLRDPATNVEIHLLPGGGSVSPGPLMLPMPARVAREPTIVDLNDLIAIKLSSYLSLPVTRMHDFADVVRLVQANHLTRDFQLPSLVRQTYTDMWDGLEAERIR